jgi:thiamine-monophosphate kinase
MSSEFEVLEKLRRKFSLGKVGDDCAVLPKDSKTDLVITADMLVEDIDFRLAWSDPESIGHKALAVSLSDIAAMGASPVWAMVSLGVPEHVWNSDFIDGFYAGWHKLAAEFNVELVGGDISRTADKIVIDSIAAGEVEKGGAILRSGAKPGDAIFVAGRLGLAALGLAALEANVDKPDDVTTEAIGFQLRPEPQIIAGKLLQNNKLATAMIDVSDGLSSDLHHLCAASGVGAVILTQKLYSPDLSYPTDPDSPEQMEYILNGGEDYALLFAADIKNFSELEKAGFHHIGEITVFADMIELSLPGVKVPLKPKGYTHF